MEVNRSVNVRQVVFLSTAEQITDKFRDRELSITAELVKEFLVLIRNRSVNVLVACKFLLSANSSHVFGLAVENSRSATLIVQNISPLLVEFRSEKQK